MQNTFSQSGNDSKWFLTKIIFQNRYVALETPPPFMANAILNFHFDFLNPSLISKQRFTILLFLKAQAGPDLSSFCAGGRPQNFNEDNERGKRIHFHP